LTCYINALLQCFLADEQVRDVIKAAPMDRYDFMTIFKPMATGTKMTTHVDEKNHPIVKNTRAFVETHVKDRDKGHRLLTILNNVHLYDFNTMGNLDGFFDVVLMQWTKTYVPIVWNMFRLAHRPRFTCHSTKKQSYGAMQDSTLINVPYPSDAHRDTIYASLQEMIYLSHAIHRKCVVCQTRDKHVRHFYFHSTPRILVINVYKGETPKEINQTVAVLMDDTRQTMVSYSIFAFVAVRNDNHWVAYVELSQDQWALCNDGTITELPASRVYKLLLTARTHSDTPFMMFYKIN